MHKLGRKLQVIPHREPRDHLPALVSARAPRIGGGQEVREEAAPDAKTRLKVAWDRDKLMQGLRGGARREAFIRQVEEEMEEVWSSLSPDLADTA
eukprot:7763719-Pyramimonas_sp.AAC.1